MSSDNTLPVLQALEEALAKGGITQYQVASWRSKFLEVHATLASAPAVEQQLLIEKKKKEVALEEARLQVEAEIAKREELKAEFESVDINKQSLAQEVATLEARDISLQQELTDLRTREGELRSEVEQLQHANQSTVSPVLNQIQSEIAQARKEIAETMSLTDSSVANSLQLKSRLENINNAILINKHQLANLETELNRIKAEPRRINAITENIGGVLELCQSELSRLKTSLEARDAEIHEQESVVREVSELKATIDQKLGRYRTDIESREEEMLGLERSLKAEKSAQRDLFERKKQLAFDCDVLTTTSKSTKSSLDMVKSQHDRTLSAFKSKEEEYKNLVQSIPNLETRLKIRKSQINKLKARCIDFRKTRDEIQKQMDVLVAQVCIPILFVITPSFRLSFCGKSFTGPDINSLSPPTVLKCGNYRKGCSRRAKWFASTMCNSRIREDPLGEGKTYCYQTTRSFETSKRFESERIGKDDNG